MRDLLQLQELGLDKLHLHVIATQQEVDLQVLFHSVNNTNPPLLIISAYDILVQTHGLCGHSTVIWLFGNEPAYPSSLLYVYMQRH